MSLLVAAAALVAALAAADPPDSSQRGSAPTPAQSNRAADDAQRGSRGSTAGGEERTGPPSAGIESGGANGLAGGRTDEGPRGGTGIRGDDGTVTRDQARNRANAQARPRNKKGSFDRPADTPPDMNRDAKPMGSGVRRGTADQRRPRSKTIPDGAQQGAAGGVASDPEESPGGSAPNGTAGKGAGTQPDKKQRGSEPDSPR